MKRIAFFLSIVVAAVACEQVEPITPPEFDFANPDVVIPYQGSEDESVKFEFKTNVDWTAELDQEYDWLTITPTSGVAGDAVITVIGKPNKETEARTAVITVKAGVSVLVFDVFQEGYPSLSVEPTELNFEAAGGSQEVTVDANVEYVVSCPENDWLEFEYNAETGVYTVTAYANEAFAPRSLTVEIENNVDDVYETIVVSQLGRASVAWEKSLADYTAIVGANPVHLAYIDDVLALSVGSAIHTIDPATGDYKAAVTLPEGFVIASMTNDDAGNVVVAPNIPAYASADIYALSSLDAEPAKVATMKNDVYSFNAGNLRAGGDVMTNGVLSMFVDVSQYWIACDIVEGAAGDTTFGALSNPAGGTVWDCGNGCVAPLGSSIEDGFLATYYCLPALMTNASGDWANVGAELYSGNDNNCAVTEAVFNGDHFAAVAVGSHFNYSATGLYLYDLETNEMVYSYKVDGELSGVGVTSDVVLVPTEDVLYMYYVDLNKGRLACIEVR